MFIFPRLIYRNCQIITHYKNSRKSNWLRIEFGFTGKDNYCYLEDYKKDTSVGIEFSKAGVNDTDWLDNRIKAIALNPSYYNSFA